MTTENEFAGVRVEIRSDREAYIDGVKTICEYEPETVKVDVGTFCIRIIGNGLALRLLAERSLYVEGQISSVEYRC